MPWVCQRRVNIMSSSMAYLHGFLQQALGGIACSSDEHALPPSTHDCLVCKYGTLGCKDIIGSCASKPVYVYNLIKILIQILNQVLPEVPRSKTRHIVLSVDRTIPGRWKWPCSNNSNWIQYAQRWFWLSATRRDDIFAFIICVSGQSVKAET